MNMNLIVPEGFVKFVFYDEKFNYFEEYEIGPKKLLQDNRSSWIMVCF